MYVIYLIYGILGWVALGLFLAFWAGMVWGRRTDTSMQQRGFKVIPTPTEEHEKQS